MILTLKVKLDIQEQETTPPEANDIIVQAGQGLRNIGLDCIGIEQMKTPVLPFDVISGIPSDIEQADEVADKLIDALQALAATGVRDEMIWRQLYIKIKRKPDDMFDCCNQLSEVLATLDWSHLE